MQELIKLSGNQLVFQRSRSLLLDSVDAICVNSLTNDFEILEERPLIFLFQVYRQTSTYHLSGVIVNWLNSASRTRTCDNLINSQVLYQLSYGGMSNALNASSIMYQRTLELIRFLNSRPSTFWVDIFAHFTIKKMYFLIEGFKKLFRLFLRYIYSSACGKIYKTR